MEINKKTVHMNFERGRARQIVTVDDDFNVPDNKPDIMKKIKDTADIVIDKVRPMEGRAAVSGKIRYRLLYSGKEGLSSMEGQIAFDEMISIDDMTDQDIIKYNCMLEDITVNVINSRKISVKAVAVINITAEAARDVEAVSGIELLNLQSVNRKINTVKLVTDKKDIFRVRESMNIPSDRANIGEIVWSELGIRNMDIRPCDGEISVKGELSVFCIYNAENTTELNFFDKIVPFSGKLQASGCTDETIPDIALCISDQSLVARPDSNGEMRILDAEVIIDLDIKGYEEEENEILADAYSPSCELKLDRTNVTYQSYFMKNSIKCRMDEKFKVPEGGILQIISDSGRINLSDTTYSRDGIVVDGSVIVDVLYIRPDDSDRIGYARYEIPFSEKADMPEADGECTYSVRPGMLQISTFLTGGNEINIKCAASAEITATKKKTDNVINGVKAEEADHERIKALPGIVGYITGKGDTLWDIAKKYCTTIKEIKDINGLTENEVAPGTRLIIVKSCR